MCIRDRVNPQASRDAAAAIWKQAGITSPIDEIDVAAVSYTHLTLPTILRV